MRAKILSLNIGGPTPMIWGEKSILSSMHKKPVAGPLVVSETAIEGDSFENPKFHGTIDSVLYAYGLTSIEKFLVRIGRTLSDFNYGDTGETLTLDHFDESEISVGDVFQIGEVTAQATWPRIPCAKVNFRFQHADGQKEMIASGVSGVYFRILKPGKILKTDVVERVKTSDVPFLISDVYSKIFGGGIGQPEIDLAKKNGAFPAREIAKWETRFGAKAGV